MFSTPRHWHNLIYFSGGMVGYWIGYNLPATWFNVMGGGGLMAAGLILIASNEIGMSADKLKEAWSLNIIDQRQEVHNEFAKVRANDPAEKAALLKVNVFRQGQAVYSNTVAPVRIDHERQMAKTLVTMRDGGFPMNISETYWIREGHWQDGPESFRATRGKWEYYNIVGKRGNASNSRYEIQNEKGVELIASGSLRLPPPPS